MDPLFVSSIIALGGLGLLFGAGLAYASKKFAVYVDPKVEQITEALPGANCGACGKPGCAAYAEAVVKGETPPNMCSPGGADVTAIIAKILGVKAEAADPKVAVVQCQGDHENAVERFTYEGVQDCSAAELVGGGSKACSYGCLGLGSCVKACPFDAMTMGENGLPVVFEDKCTACNVCVTTCPRGIMALIPRKQKVFLGCVSLDKAKDVKSVCKVGCFACKICATPKVTPEGHIEMDGNLPVIKNIESDDLYTAFDKCPSNCYVIRIPRPEVQVVEEVSSESES